MAALVYGLSNAATSPDGTSHWGDAKVVAALTAGVVLLAAFAVIEARSRHALLPVRLLRSRDRVGAYLIMLGVGTAIAGVFFFLTLFVQDVWGYSALRTGVAFLPVTAAMLVGAGAAARLVPRIGARPLLMAGSAATAGGLYWLSRMTEHGTYAGDLLGASLVLGVGFGLLIVPLQLSPWPAWPRRTPGWPPACSTPAGRWAAPSASRCWAPWPGRWSPTAPAPTPPARLAACRTAAYRHALAAGFDRAFLVGAGIAVLMLVIAITTIRIRRADLASRDEAGQQTITAHAA